MYSGWEHLQSPEECAWKYMGNKTLLDIQLITFKYLFHVCAIFILNSYITLASVRHKHDIPELNIFTIYEHVSGTVLPSYLAQWDQKYKLLVLVSAGKYYSTRLWFWITESSIPPRMASFLLKWHCLKLNKMRKNAQRLLSFLGTLYWHHRRRRWWCTATA